MKALTLLSSLACSSVLHATIHTVSNVATQPAQFATVDDAIAAAAATDTIYITGSATPYAAFTFDKPLTIIGAGYANSGLESNVNVVYFTSGSSGSRLSGLVVSGNIYPDANSSTNVDIVIERCNFGYLSIYGYALNGLVVRNCVFYGFTVAASWTNVLVTNNLITGGISGPGTPIPSVLITNNTFVSASQQLALAGFNAAIISNNIFWGNTPVDAGMQYCAFSNNITYQTSNDALPYGTNAGSGNYIGVDPLFVNAPDQSGVLTYDYHLQAGSPGHNGGTDGTDVGIYGGGAPFPASMDGRARIPLVTQFNILNSTIPEGGSLNIEVEGRKND